MSRQLFHLLLERYLSGTCTPEEEEIVKQWYDLLDQEQTLDLSDVSFEELENRLWTKISEAAKKKKVKTRYFVARDGFWIAASLFLPLLLIGFWINWKFNYLPSSPQFAKVQHSHQICIQNKKNKKKEIHLPDHSKVILYPGASIVYPRFFLSDKREVILTGDARFLVQANPSKPFFVFHGDLITRVLGTEFLIKSDTHAKEDEVIVYSGKVEVIKSEKHENFLRRLTSLPKIAQLTINQRVILAQENNEFRETLAERPIPLHEEDIGSTNFQEVTLAAVAKELTRLYAIDIQVAKDLQKVTFTGDLSDMELFKQLEFICGVTQSSYQLYGKTILIHKLNKN